jgi:hypothetical protein
MPWLAIIGPAAVVTYVVLFLTRPIDPDNVAFEDRLRNAA